MEKTTVCILDDEPIVGDRLKPELEDDGYRVEVFTDGAGLLDRLDQTCFDICITDLIMEGMDGMEFLEKFKDKCPGSEVIVVTGYGTLERAEKALIKGACDFITKPFRIAEIRAAVKKARKRLHRHSE